MLVGYRTFSVIHVWVVNFCRCTYMLTKSITACQIGHYTRQGRIAGKAGLHLRRDDLLVFLDVLLQLLHVEVQEFGKVIRHALRSRVYFLIIGWKRNAFSDIQKEDPATQTRIPATKYQVKTYLLYLKISEAVVQESMPFTELVCVLLKS